MDEYLIYGKCIASLIILVPLFIREWRLISTGVSRFKYTIRIHTGAEYVASSYNQNTVDEIMDTIIADFGFLFSF